MHEGHRKRMRERFTATQGFDGFSNFELLEMLLYYSIPRGDTNPCAHLLIEQFGGIKNLLEATPDELCRVKGIGIQSAVLIRLVTELMRRYAGEKSGELRQCQNLQSVRDYLFKLFLGVNVERLYMLLFNDRLDMIDCVLLSEGTAGGTNLPLRLAVDKIVHKRATAVILAHNHPNGLAIPSDSDHEMTSSLFHFLDVIEVALIEHFIVSDTRIWPTMLGTYGMNRRAPVGDTDGSLFYKQFYNVKEEDYQFPFDILLRN